MKIKNKNIPYFLLCVIALQVFMLLSLKFTAWPEMTLWPYLMTKGWLPYRDIAIAHTPLMLVDLSIFYAIFGTGIWQLKIFTWLLVIGFDVLIYWVVKKFWNSKTALVALISFVLLQLFYDGNGLWFDLYMGLFAFVSYYFVKQKNYFWTGVFWALAFISKQTAVWFLLPIALEIIKGEKLKAKSFLQTVYGGSVVAGVFVIILMVFGLLPSFFNWAVNFGLFILPKAQGQIQLPGLKNLIVSLFPFLIFVPLFWQTKGKNLNLLVWALSGCLGAYPRFEYFHFQPAVPYLVIAVANFFSNEVRKNPQFKIFAVLYLAGCLYLFSGFFMRNYKEGVRFYEKDVQNVVVYIKNNTSLNDKIFVMNWWDNVYALSGRMPAIDPWVPQLSWYMEIPGIQEDIVNDLQKDKPKLIILSQYSEVGLSAYIPQKVYNYVMQNYKIKEKVDGINILVPNK